MDTHSERCCCGCHVHTATKWLAVCMLIATGVSLAATVGKVTTDTTQHNEDLFQWHTGGKILSFPIKILVYGMLLYGAIKHKHKFYYPALTLFFIGCALMMLLTVLYSMMIVLLIFSASARDYFKEYSTVVVGSFMMVFIMITWVVCYITGIIYRSFKLYKFEAQYSAAVSYGDGKDFP